MCVCRMGSALLSRFDVVFLLLDVPDESHDRRLSEHVMAVRSGKGGASGAVVTRGDYHQSQSSLLEPSDTPLSDRLQVPTHKYQSTLSKSMEFLTLSLSLLGVSRGVCRPHPPLPAEKICWLCPSLRSSLTLYRRCPDAPGLLPLPTLTHTPRRQHTHHHTPAGVPHPPHRGRQTHSLKYTHGI